MKKRAAPLIEAFGYIRVSGRGQLDGDGFPRQRAAIEAYAAANGLRIVKWFEERPVCGATEWDRDLTNRGVALISAAEPDLDSDPARVLFRQVMGAIAQYDRTMIVLKLRAARKRMKATEGSREGRKPYGERPGEQAIPDWIMGQHAAGATFDAIAAGTECRRLAHSDCGAPLVWCDGRQNHPTPGAGRLIRHLIPNSHTRPSFGVALFI